MGAVPRTGVVVAIDGPSGSGKSSTARGAAHRLGLRFLDTGAQFRAMAVWMLRHGVDVHDADAVAVRAGEPRIVSGTDPLDPTITLDGEDVAQAIRTSEATAAVSPVATVPAVRRRLLELQRAVISTALAEGGIVVEGRDIGSVVWPDAEVKLYLTADAGARASRRAAESGAASVAATEEALLRRDAIDSGRATAPLVAADGAIHLDTTPWTLEEVVDQVVDIVERARAAQGRPAPDRASS